jgi:hypothetical protein
MLGVTLGMDICIVWRAPVMCAVVAGCINTRPLLRHMLPFGDVPTVWKVITVHRCVITVLVEECCFADGL